MESERSLAGATPLHLAAWDRPAAVELLLTFGADPAARDGTGATPLHRAIGNIVREEFVVEALLKAGADPTAPDNEGVTPLHKAARESYHPTVLADMLAAGADPMARDNGGSSPLHYAVMRLPTSYIHHTLRGLRLGARAGAIDVLLDAGADPMAQDDAGRTPWDLAQDTGPLKTTDAYRRLNDARAEVLDRDVTVSPARPAANCGAWNTGAYFETASVAEVAACVDAGADPMVRSHDGRTPLHQAAASTDTQ
jgi:cytohesin